MDGNVQGIFRGIKRRFLATENSQVWLKCHLDETYHKQCSKNKNIVQKKKKIETHAHFERPRNKLKNVTSKLKILKLKLENLK